MKYKYKCVNCGNIIENESIIYLCGDCEKINSKENPPAGVLKVLYNYETIGKSSLNFHLKSGFIDFLPIQSKNSLPFLHIGNTPLYTVNKLNTKFNCRLYFKDDSQNPTFSFKDRASAIVTAWAKENGINKIIT